MNKILMILGAAFCTLPMFAQPQLRKDNIDEVLKAMTLEEKAGLAVGASRPVNIGGIPTGSTMLVPGAAGVTRAIPRLGIPATVLADGPAGLRIDPVRPGSDATFYCTGFPVGTLLASSWDVDLVEKVTAAMGDEVLEYGVDVLLAPGMNIHRNPLCGRNFEYFSEDPVLSGKIAAAYVRGVQSNGVGTSIKHYAANNQETNRLENDARVSERALREIYLKNFEIAVRESDPWTVMSSYNRLNGEFTQQSHFLLTSVLRNDWGFKGIVMTDWGNKAGTVTAVKAGNDLMEPGAETEIVRILDAVRNGSLPIEDLDRNVRRILEYIVRTPRFNGYQYSEKPDLAAHAKVALDAAGESVVMLRNEAALPLEGGEKVALYGISSVDFIAGGTGSGNVNKAYIVNMRQGLENAGFQLDKDLVDFYDANYRYANASRNMSSSGQYILLGSPKLKEVDIPAETIRDQAKTDDVAVVVIGRNAGEGADRNVEDDFELSEVERNLICRVSRAYHAEGKKVIVILNIGGVIETASWKNQVDAILLPWSPGQEGANAIAQVLKGEINPSGKLPMTFPVNYMDHLSSRNFPDEYSRFLQSNRRRSRTAVKDIDYTDYAEGIWVGYRLFDTRDIEVSYPFGYGLSYTSFSYDKPSVKASEDGFIASVTVTNTGSVAGREVVEVYVSAPAGGLEKPARELKAFAKTGLLAPGESQTLTFKVSAYELASFNEEASRWETASGRYDVLFGASVEDIRAKDSFKLGKPQFFQVDRH